MSDPEYKFVGTFLDNNRHGVCKCFLTSDIVNQVSTHGKVSGGAKPSGEEARSMVNKLSIIGESHSSI